MSVYIDNLMEVRGRMVVCRMMADSDTELHAMADRIGIERRHWREHAGRFASHYEIGLSKRALAVKSGAVEVSARRMFHMLMDGVSASQHRSQSNWNRSGIRNARAEQAALLMSGA